MIKQEKSRVRLRGGKVPVHLEEDGLEMMAVKRKCGCGSNNYKNRTKEKRNTSKDGIN